jgi:hypothetical protein
MLCTKQYIFHCPSTFSAALHARAVGLFSCLRAADEERHLTHQRALRVSQTLLAQHARSAGAPGALEFDCFQPAQIQRAATLIEALACRADAVRAILRELKILGLEQPILPGLGVRFTGTSRLVVIGALEAWVAFAKHRIGDVALDLLLRQVLRVPFAFSASISFIRFSSDTDTPPYLPRQLNYVARLMPCFRGSSPMPTPHPLSRSRRSAIP